MAQSKSRRKGGRTWVFAIASAGLISVLFIAGLLTGALEPFERRLLDLRFTSFNQDNPVSDRIVYIDVDDVSLQTLSPQVGGWPWPRGDVIAGLVLDYVMFGNPSGFYFDIIYSEYSPKPIGQEGVPEQDMWLLESSMMYPTASHAVLFTVEDIAEPKPMFEGAEYNFAMPIDTETSAVDLADYNHYLAPFDPLYAYANSLHAVNHTEDEDGISREYEPIVRYGDVYYPSLGVRAIQHALGIESVEVDRRTLRLTASESDTVIEAPLTDNGHVRLNFYQDNNDFEAYPVDRVIASAQQFFSGEEDVDLGPEVFEGKIVIIGASALGLKDVKITPMGKNIAGPYVHITAISNMLEGHFLYDLPLWATIAIVVALVALVMVATLLLPEGVLRTTTGVIVIVAAVVVSLVIFKAGGVVVHMTAIVAAPAITYIAALVYLTILEQREKSRISSAMGKYLSPSVMSEVLDKYDELVSEVGETREISILFSDIRGFTTISEQFAADEVVEVLNTYLARMIAVVFDHRGTLDKIIGDAIMAFWGAPNTEDARDLLAVQTAVAMVRELDVVNAELAERGKPALRIGIGVHTGDMIVGNIGSDQRLDYTAIGDNVNLGSRIEGLTKYYKVPVLATEPAYENTKNEFPYVFLDSVAVKGKSKGIGIFTPILAGHPSDRADGLRDAFEEARGLYVDKGFETALKRFDEIEHDENPLSGVAQVFRTRCEAFLKSPPPENWNGIWKMTEK